MNVLSPCKKICRVSHDGKYCIGCLRTILEISNWNKFGDKKKRKIVEQLKKRGTNV